MILRSHQEERDRAAWLARRQWRIVYMPIARLHVEGFGKVWVFSQRLETRWSDSNRRRLWRVPR